MSTVIENQIVQMSFDNKEFEKNISASMKSLDQFKEEMDFQDSARNFKDLEKASESIDFDKLNKAIDGVGDHFTLVGRVFYKVTDEIANYFTSKITGAVNAIKSVTTDIIDPKAGYRKYDEYTHGVKNILAALSDEELAKLEANGASAIDGVEAKLSELMAYTDETSYNFTDMVGTIGKFLGAGINLDSAVADMQGIANWAALSGQNATVASQAMYQMSQALGAGYVKYQDWTQMANLKSMGTTAAKDVFIEAAKEAGTIQAEDLAEARKILGKDATDAQIRNWFFEANQLNNENARWFTTEVLEKGLQKFSSVSNEVIPLVNELNEDSDLTVTQFIRMGEQMKKTGMSAQDMVDKMMAEGKIDLVGSDYDTVIEKLGRLTSEEYKVGWNALKAAQEATTFSEAIDATKDAVSTQFLKIFKSLIGNYEEAAELWTNLANSMYDIFAQPLSDVAQALGDWSKEASGIFDETGKELTKREALWSGLAKIGTGLINIFSTLFKILSGTSGSLDNNVVKVFDKLVNVLHAVGDAINAIVESRTVAALGHLMGAVWRLVSLVVTAFWKLVKAITGTDNVLSNSLDDSLSSVVFFFYDVLDIVGRIIDKIISSKGFNFALGLLSRAFNVLYSAINVVVKVFDALWIMCSAIVIQVLDPLNSELSIIWDGFYNLGWAVANFVGRLMSFFGFNWVAINKVTRLIINTFNFIGKTVYHFLDEVLKPLEFGVEGVTDVIPKLIDFAMNLIGNSFKTAIKIIGNFIAALLGIDPDIVSDELEAIGNNVLAFFTDFGKRAQKAFSLICFDIFKWLPIRFSEMVDDLKTGTVPQKVEAVFKFIGDCLKRGVGTIIDAVGSLVGVDLGEFKDKVLGFLDSFTDQLAKLNPGWEATWDTIGEIFWGLVAIFKGLADAIFWIIGQVTGIEDMGPDKILDLIGWLLEKMVNVVVLLATGIGTVVKAVGPLIIGSLSFLKDIFKQLWLALSYVIGTDKSPEALKALENVKSVLRTLLLIFLVFKVWGFFKAAKGFMEGFADISDAITGRGFGNMYKTTVRMIGFIGLILVALAVLANQDFGRVVGAVLALFVTLELIMMMFKSINKSVTKFVKEVGKTRISDQALDSTFKYLTKLLIRMGVLALIMTVTLGIMAKNIKKYGASEMILAVMALTVSMAVLVVGVKGIIKASSKLGTNADAKLAGATKLVIKVSAAFSIISLAFRFLISSINNSIAKNGGSDKAVMDAMKIMAMSMIALVVGTVIFIKTGQKLQPKQLDAIGTAVYKTMAGVMFIAVALAVLLKAFDFLGVSGGGGGDLANGDVPPATNSEFGLRMGAAFGALVAVIALMAVAVAIINKLTKGDMPAKMQKASTTIANTISSLFYLTASMQAMVVLVASMIGTFFLLYMVIDKMDVFGMLKAFGLTVILFFAAVEMVKLMTSVKIEGEWQNILAFSVAILSLSVAILATAAAFAILSTVSTLITLEGIGAFAVAMILLAAVVAIVAATTKLIGPDKVKALLSLSVTILAVAAAIGIIAAALTLLCLIDTTKLIDVAKAVGIIAVALAVGFAIIAAAVGIFRPTAKMIEEIGKTMIRFALALAIVVAVLLVLAGIEPILADVLTRVISVINQLSERMPELVEALVVLVIAMISALAESIGDHAEELAESILNLIFAIADVILSLLGMIFGPWMPIFEKIGGWFQELGKTIAEGFSDALEAIKKAGKAIKDVFDGIWNTVKFIGIAIWTAVSDAFNKVREIIGNVLAAIIGLIQYEVDFFKAQWERIKSIFELIGEIITGFPKKVWEDGLLAGLKWLWDKLVDIAKLIWDAFTAPFKAAFELGKNIVTGLWNGINDLVEWVCKKIEGFCGKALGAIKKFFGIKSPSKVMAEIGNFMMQGLGNGLSQGEGGVLDKVTSIASNVLGGFSGMTDIPVGFDTSSIPGMTDLSVDNLTVDGMLDYGDTLAFDPSSAGLSSVYSMDVVPNYNAMGGMDIPTNFQPTIKDSQLEQITDAEMTGTQDIVDAINSMKEEISKQAEIISKYQMILDTGVLVGELTAPIDKALGNRSRLATGRGI